MPFPGRSSQGGLSPGQVFHASVSGSGWRAVMTQREVADRSHGPPDMVPPDIVPGDRAAAPARALRSPYRSRHCRSSGGEGVQLLRQGTQRSVPASQSSLTTDFSDAPPLTILAKAGIPHTDITAAPLLSVLAKAGIPHAGTAAAQACSTHADILASAHEEAHHITDSAVMYTALLWALTHRCNTLQISTSMDIPA